MGLTDEPFKISPYYKSSHVIQLAQNELNMFDNPWYVFSKENKTIEFLTVEKVESVERFKIESVFS